MQEVRRSDGELCGHVRSHAGRWQALTVFGSALSDHDTEDEARRHVCEQGLASLADRWTLIDTGSGACQVVCIQQASPAEVTLALDYYSMPGVDTMTIRAQDLRAGRWRLERRI